MRRGIGLALGFGLAKAVTYNAYNTAFGSGAQPSLGFMSSTGFVLAGNALSALVAIIVVILAVRGADAWRASGARRAACHAAPSGSDEPTASTGATPVGHAGGSVALDAAGEGRFRRAPGASGRLMALVCGAPLLAVACASCLLLVAGYLLGAAGVFTGLPTDVGIKVLTLLYSLGSVLLTVTWFVPFARLGEARLAVYALLGGYFVQAVLHVGLSLLDGWALPVVCVALLAVSCALLAWALHMTGCGMAPKGRRASASVASVSGAIAPGARAASLGSQPPAASGAGSCAGASSGARSRSAASTARASSGGLAGVSSSASASPGGSDGAGVSAVPTSPKERAAALKAALRGLFGPLACVFILTAVIGLMHTSVIGGSLEPVVGAIPMAEALALATLIMAAAVLLSRRVPDTTLVYRALFPVMLAALSLLPFVSEMLGPLSGMAMVVCYELVSIAFMLLLVEVSQVRPQVSPAALVGTYLAGTKLALIVGLLLGLAIDLLGAHSSEASYVTILMLACIYLLSMTLMVLLRRRTAAPAMVPAPVRTRRDEAARPGAPASERTWSRGMEPAGQHNASAGSSASDMASGSWLSAFDAPGVAGGAYSLAGFAAADEGEGLSSSDVPATRLTPGQHVEQQSIREQVGARVEHFARERGLTPRESQVLVHLARGRSAPALAADLGITENTAWAHIKRIYTKLGVHSKQELIDLVEREVISPAAGAPPDPTTQPRP